MGTPGALLLTDIRRGTAYVTRAELASLPTPPPTKTFAPVPHAEFVGHIVAALRARKIEIQREDFAVMRGGLMLFGVMDLRHGRKGDGCAALGLRNSNNKRLSMEIAVGMRVVVCDNLVFSGDLIALHRRHTGKVNLAGEVKKALDRFTAGFVNLKHGLAKLKDTAITDDEARKRILDVLKTGTVPSRFVKEILHHYFEASLPAFQPRTLWSLHNAFTLTFRGMSPQIAFAATTALGQVFELESAFDDRSNPRRATALAR